MDKHWPRGVHTIKDGWTHVASIEVQDTHDIAMHVNSRKLDVYVHTNKEQYPGVSIQFGEDEREYSSNGFPYIDDPIVSLEDGLHKTFGKVFNRCTKRYKADLHGEIYRLSVENRQLKDFAKSEFGEHFYECFRAWKESQ